MNAAPAAPIRVTIVVVTFNSRRFFERLRTAIDGLATPHELIVLDNGSRAEDRPSPDDFPRAIILQQEGNLGFARGNNIAVEAASTEYVALLNPDAFPHPNWLEALLAAADHYGPKTVIGSTQLLDGAPELFDGLGDVMHAAGLAYRAAHRRRRTDMPPVEGEVFSACAAALLIRRDHFLGLGGFDERFFCYMEDVELGFRVRLTGGRAVQAPRAIVSHVSGGVSGAESGFADFHGARNRIWTFVQCMPGPMMWLLLLPHVLATIIVLCVHGAQGRWASWRGAWAGLKGLPSALSRRRDIQAARSAPMAAIIRALAWSPFVLVGRKPVTHVLTRNDGQL